MSITFDAGIDTILREVSNAFVSVFDTLLGSTKLRSVAPLATSAVILSPRLEYAESMTRQSGEQDSVAKYVSG